MHDIKLPSSKREVVGGGSVRPPYQVPSMTTGSVSDRTFSFSFSFSSGPFSYGFAGSG